MAKPLQFAPYSSTLDGGFWHKLSKLKLDVFGLDDKQRQINGFYGNGERYLSHNKRLAVPAGLFFLHGH